MVTMERIFYHIGGVVDAKIQAYKCRRVKSLKHGIVHFTYEFKWRSALELTALSFRPGRIVYGVLKSRQTILKTGF